jgi:hypothetical protein
MIILAPTCSCCASPHRRETGAYRTSRPVNGAGDNNEPGRDYPDVDSSYRARRVGTGGGVGDPARQRDAVGQPERVVSIFPRCCSDRPGHRVAYSR